MFRRFGGIEAKPYAAFKHVLLKCYMKKGEEYPLQNTRKLGWRFILSGHIKSTFNNGDIVFYKPGDLSIDNSTVSNRTMEFLEDTEWFCMSNIGNDELFTPEFIRLSKNETIAVNNNSDIFLAKGSISANSKDYDGPYAIRVRSDNVILKANTNSYLFKFK